MVNKESLHTGKIVEWISVFCCLLFAFYVRLLPYSVVITKKSVNFFAQDPYYHARRIQLALANHWIIPTYDSYSGFPQGLYCFWSNLFDYSILWTGFLIGKGHPTIRQLEIITAFAPVIWGVLSLIPAYLLVKKVFNLRIALLSIFFISILPGHIYQTILGRSDHYGADAFFPLFMFYFLINALTPSPAPPLTQPSPLNKGEGVIKKEDRRWSGFCAGICAALSWLVWPGSTIFIGIAIVYILIQSIFDYQNPRLNHSCLWTGLFVLFITWIILSPFCITSYWGKHGMISYDSISWFQWIFLILAMFVFTIVDILQGYFKTRGYTLRIYILGLISTIGFVWMITWLLVPEFIDSFLSGLGWVGKTDPWLQTITEFQPLFISIGVFSTFRAITFFSYVIYLLPIIYLVLFWTWLKENSKRETRNSKLASRLWFIIYFVGISFLGLYQTRFSHFFVLIVAVGLSLLCVTIWNKGVRSKELGVRYHPSPITYLLSPISCILLLHILLSPVFQEIQSIRGKYAVVPYPWRETLQWIRENTPETSYFDQPYREPEYGILAPWIAGHWINYIAQRPTFANGFHTNSKNNQAGMEFFLTEDLNESNTILENNKIRYIVLTDMTPNIQGYARVLGKDDSDYIFESIYHPPGGGTQILFLPTSKFNHLISSQLYLNDQFSASELETRNSKLETPLGCYRLVYETPEQWDMGNKKVNEIKVFEYVKGAIIRGMAKAGTPIHLSVPVITNSGRNFLYQQDTFTNPQGMFEFIAPYSQTSCSERHHAMVQTHATAPYSIELGKKIERYHAMVQIDVDEKAVTQGKVVILRDTMKWSQ
jgi:dolichyl-phosphooligosaccharide-protein glycotransferase